MIDYANDTAFQAQLSRHQNDLQSVVDQVSGGGPLWFLTQRGREKRGARRAAARRMVDHFQGMADSIRSGDIASFDQLKMAGVRAPAFLAMGVSYDAEASGQWGNVIAIILKILAAVDTMDKAMLLIKMIIFVLTALL